MTDILKKELTKEEAISGLENQINQALYDLEYNYFPNLGHSETKRLLLASKRYPMVNPDFSGESDTMKQALSACKAIHDAQVALGVEVVIEQMVGNLGKQVETQTDTTKE